MTRRNVRVPKPKKQTRRKETELALVAAVGTLLRRDGFGAIGVNAVAREAGVDKVLIYRYFGGLSELLRAYGESADFWPSYPEIFGDDFELMREPDLARLGRVFLERYASALRRRPATLELLAWEMAQRNELTAVLEEVREAWSDRLGELFFEHRVPVTPGMNALMVTLTAAIHYLLVRGREIRVFGGLEIGEDAGWTAMFDVYEATLKGYLEQTAVADA